MIRVENGSVQSKQCIVQVTIIVAVELDRKLQSISASIEGSLPENTASWQAGFRWPMRSPIAIKTANSTRP
jgi:hypothetical protein